MAAIAQVHDVQQLRYRVERWRNDGLHTAIVPTMGALHDGHLHLVNQALRRADRVVVSIFINPKQFAAGEDLEKYPRDADGDIARLKQAGAHLVYTPSLQTIYPENFATNVVVDGPAKANLEDKYRPHFFDGVATVVAKLLIQAQCDYAMFGEKDYQQLRVVTRMARDLDIPVTVVGVETVRETDGLAMSSRNAYLSATERQIASQLHQDLQKVAKTIRNDGEHDKACNLARRRLSRAGFRMDYLTARNANTLAKLTTPSEPVRLLAAGWLGKTRLIDNIDV